MKVLTIIVTVALAASSFMPVLQAADAGNARQGESLWRQKFTVDGQSRSCVTCHTVDPGKAGKHERTGKVIEPMAVAANPERLSDPNKVAKWFKRNCLWTLGRECSAQEKADVMQYLKTY